MTSAVQPELPLANMHERHPGLTQQIAEAYEQAARVCLDRHHAPPVVFEISDAGNETFVKVIWLSTVATERNAWANEIDATEWGAYGCALAAAEITRGHVAVRRAETRTGADYYVGPPGTGIEDLEKCFRLEISGTDSGNAARLRATLAEKVQQTSDGSSNLPAIAAVVGFKERRILIATCGEEGGA